MRIRLVPVVIAFALPTATWLSYVSQSDARIMQLRSRVETASRQVATLQSGAVIEPRLRAERTAIAARLADVRALEPAEADEQLVVAIAAIARRAGARLDAVSTKGVTTLAPTPAPTAVPLAAAPRATPASSSAPAVGGSRTARVITVSGGLGSALRFVDGLGRAPVPIEVTSVTLQQGDRLTAAVSVDVLTIDRVTLEDAKRAELTPPADRPLEGAGPRSFVRPSRLPAPPAPVSQ